MLFEESDDVFFSVGTARTRYHGDSEWQTLRENVLLEVQLHLRP